MDTALAPPPFIHRACPICATDAYRELVAHPPWRLVACNSCGLAYLPDIPPPEALDEEFEWDDSFKRERLARWMRNPFFRAWTGLMIAVRPRREDRALRRIQSAIPRGKLLDVGCGDGRLIAAALARGFDAYGIELSPKMAAKARRRVPEERILVGRFEDAQFAPSSFDAVVTVSYLEHEPQPAGLLRQAYAWLRPGGLCIHKVPNYGSRLAKIMGSRWSGFRWPEHVQYYTPATLSRLMSDNGFRVTRVDANPFGDNCWVFAEKPGAAGSE